MQNLDFKNSYVLVEEVLSDKPYEKTEKVYLNQNDGGRVGPFVRKSFDNKNSLGMVYKILQGHNHPNLPAIYYVSDSVVFEEFIEGRRFSKDDIEYFSQVCDAVKFLHTNFNKPVIHRDIKPENIIITQDGVAKLIDFGIAREYVAGQLTDTQYFGTVGFAAPEQFGFAQTDVRSDIFSLGKLLNYVTDDYKDIVKRATSLDPSDRYKTVNDLKRDFEKSYNKSPAIKKLGIVWNILLTLIFLGFVALTIWTIFFAPDKINTKSLPQAIVMAIMLIDFIFFPLYYISLYRFKWMIKLNWKNRISIIVCCGFAVFVLAIISTLL